MTFDPTLLRFTLGGIGLGALVPLIDGEIVASLAFAANETQCVWHLAAPWEGVTLRLNIEVGAITTLRLRADGLAPDRPVDSLGLRFGAVAGVARYLRNGYQSWDGSFLVTPGERAQDPNPARAPDLGFAFTGLLPRQDSGAVIVGFTRHDRFQSRFHWRGTADDLVMDVETLWDRARHAGQIFAEPIVLFESLSLEQGCQTWDDIVADAAPVAPRRLDRRITGWCSWYSLYAAIDETRILDHLAGAADFRDTRDVPLEVFLIDDGFTPEMGDWLDVKPQFPRGMASLLADIATAGFTPGLWIAPFMVGNRSKLFAQHPDWVVRERATGEPLVHMRFYGEFRWHKRSEEYYPLDITHPEAEAYIRQVFRTWRAWGCGYFKTDFMLFGAEYGPDRAIWREDGVSRIAIFQKMMRLIREEIGEALWLGCGCPLWASIGYVDAMRIGRDIGVSWKGDYSAESLLRDQVTRNHASGRLWQADPDCILLRSRFHELSDDEVRSLALFAGLAGGVLMTSDHLGELSPERAALFAALLRETRLRCEFPQLGVETRPGAIVQTATRPNGEVLTHLFNASNVKMEVGGQVLPAHHSRLSDDGLLR
ncbi:glycoside hydrolase family 36 protein [Caulobacter sp. 1776]|uniref:glycoside hydrolase family 36 protein n=1 Tax=Caulobacter sp. 1776 TaxID=3156420 RepID=UPI00339934B2